MSEKIIAVTAGSVKTLKSLKDGVFSEKMLGDGAVVKVPAGVKEFEVVAPVSGKLITVFPSGHAYGIQTKSGVEVLVHIGLETVNLDGKGFTIKVKQGKKVKAGAVMAVVDAEFVRKNAPAIDPIVIITSGQAVTEVAKGSVEAKDDLFTV